MMKLEAKGLSFRHAKHPDPILDGVSLWVESGECVGLQAPSGRGKTTLCRLLAGYEKPQSGAVLLDGQPLFRGRGPCPVQLIWQHPEEAVDPFLRLGDSLREGGPLSPHILEGLCIRGAWLERYPAELSGGELQRLCVARALGGHTSFLLCDEMTAMLDAVSQAALWRFVLDECRRRNIGILAVSHSTALLDRICSRQVTL